MADEVSTKVRSVVEKLLEADMTDQIARRGRELATAVAEATETVSARAGDAWRESEPQRKDAEKAARRAGKDAVKWSRRTWRKELSPTLRDLWKRRTAAVSAAGAAIPAGQQIVEEAAVRLGIRKERERRHWVAFFLGLLVGAAAGAIVAMLTTPKPGREMRDELAETARDAADKVREEWVPLFQREPTNGSPEPSGSDGNEISAPDGSAEASVDLSGMEIPAPQAPAAAEAIDAATEGDDTP